MQAEKARKEEFRNNLIAAFRQNDEDEDELLNWEADLIKSGVKTQEGNFQILAA